MMWCSIMCNLLLIFHLILCLLLWCGTLILLPNQWMLVILCFPFLLGYDALSLDSWSTVLQDNSCLKMSESNLASHPRKMATSNTLQLSINYVLCNHPVYKCILSNSQQVFHTCQNKMFTLDPSTILELLLNVTVAHFKCTLITVLSLVCTSD
jgi:hypothetical protein